MRRSRHALDERLACRIEVLLRRARPCFQSVASGSSSRLFPRSARSVLPVREHAPQEKTKKSGRAAGLKTRPSSAIDGGQDLSRPDADDRAGLPPDRARTRSCVAHVRVARWRGKLRRYSRGLSHRHCATGEGILDARRPCAPSGIGRSSLGSRAEETARWSQVCPMRAEDPAPERRALVHVVQRSVPQRLFPSARSRARRNWTTLSLGPSEQAFV